MTEHTMLCWRRAMNLTNPQPCDCGAEPDECCSAAPMAECPVTLNHTPGPDGYLARAEWADEMLKTHRQKKCRSCGLWVIWEPKPAASPRPNRSAR